MLDAEHALDDLPRNQTAAQANLIRFFRGDAQMIGVALAATTAAKVSAIPAVANHGRWIVECPSGDGGAQFASRTDPRFMCQECLNAASGGRWLPVTWPVDAAKIDEILDARPECANRNWRPGETVTDLRRESAAYRR